MLPLFGGAISAFERLRKDIETQPTIDNTSSSAEKPTNVDGTVEFRNVAFTYSSRPDHPVLNGISLTCEAGTSNATRNPEHSNASGVWLKFL
jgi:ATP-binding cassette subfamily B (MDR/TAP) protein 1